VRVPPAEGPRPEQLDSAKSRSSRTGGKLRSAVLRYALPFAVMGVATGLALFIHRVLGQHPGVQITFWIALLASAWWGGYVPGVIASILAIYVVPYAFGQKFHPTLQDFTRLVLISGLMLLVSHIAARRRRAEQALAHANEMLEQRVRQRTEELQRSNMELQRVNRALNQFAYSASHDLQEPLRMLKLYSQMLERKCSGQLDTHANEYIAYITQGATRMDMLVTGLLSFTTTINIQREDVQIVDASDVARNAIANLKASIEESGATVVCDPLPRVRIQEIHLLQIFQNLIGNAIKYRSKEPPRVEIRARKDRANSWIICVIDNGIGVPRQYSDQIFQMFQRLHNSNEYAGTGMGLAICRAVLEHYEGRIWVESEEGCGSTFCFSVPGEDVQLSRS